MARISLISLLKELRRRRVYQTVALYAEYDDGIRHPTTLAHLAQAYAMQGRDDDALDMLRNAVDYHYQSSPCDVEWQNDVFYRWDRLRGDPRPIALCNQIETDLEQQADRIRSTLAGYDVDELLATVIEMAEKGAGDRDHTD